MKIEDIDVGSAIDSAKTLLRKERDLSPAFRSALEVLLLLVTVLLNRITLNSQNSSKPPSADPNREKSPKKGQSARKPVTTRRLQIIEGDSLPGRIPFRDVVLARDGNEDWCVGMRCPCGCGETIELLLIHEVTPRWDLRTQTPKACQASSHRFG